MPMPCMPTASTERTHAAKNAAVTADADAGAPAKRRRLHRQPRQPVRLRLRPKLPARQPITTAADVDVDAADAAASPIAAASRSHVNRFRSAVKRKPSIVSAVIQTAAAISIHADAVIPSGLSSLTRVGSAAQTFIVKAAAPHVTAANKRITCLIRMHWIQNAALCVKILANGYPCERRLCGKFRTAVFSYADSIR